MSDDARARPRRLQRARFVGLARVDAVSDKGSSRSRRAAQPQALDPTALPRVSDKALVGLGKRCANLVSPGAALGPSPHGPERRGRARARGGPPGPQALNIAGAARVAEGQAPWRSAARACTRST